MDSVMKSEIFFFIAAVGTVLIVTLLSIAAVYLIKFLRKANRISDKVEDSVEDVTDRVKKSNLLSFLFQKKTKAGKSKN